LLLTKECDYGIRIVRGLSDGRRKSVGELCADENIPMPYAYKILKKLERSGIVKGYRGPSGGYRLEKELSGLSLFDIAASVDNEIFILECMKKDYVCPQNTTGWGCAVHLELARLQKMLMAAMTERSLDEVFGDGDANTAM